jgi:hypothetical protein
MSTDTEEFIRIGEAARLLAFHLGQRFESGAEPHLGTARGKLLDAAKTGKFSIVAGPKAWSGAAAFPLPMECALGLDSDHIDWDASIFDASADIPIEATAAIQHIHSGPSTLWVPLRLLTETFGIDDQTVGRWNRR